MATVKRKCTEHEINLDYIADVEVGWAFRPNKGTPAAAGGFMYKKVRIKAKITWEECETFDAGGGMVATIITNYKVTEISREDVP